MSGNGRQRNEGLAANRDDGMMAVETLVRLMFSLFSSRQPHRKS